MSKVAVVGAAAALVVVFSLAIFRLPLVSSLPVAEAKTSNVTLQGFSTSYNSAPRAVSPGNLPAGAAEGHARGSGVELTAAVPVTISVLPADVSVEVGQVFTFPLIAVSSRYCGQTG